MNASATARQVLIVIFAFVALSQLLFTWRNITLFDRQYTDLTDRQIITLGQTVQNALSIGLDKGIPLERIGRVNPFLEKIVNDTPQLAFIDIIADAQPVFSAERTRQALRTLELPIMVNGSAVATVQMGIAPMVRKQALRVFYDLLTIVLAGLIMTYELLKFFTSRMVSIPGREAVRTANRQLERIYHFPYISRAPELSEFLTDVFNAVQSTRTRLEELARRLDRLYQAARAGTEHGRDYFLQLISAKHAAVTQLTTGECRFEPIINPAHVRPLIFIFILSANLHSSFLPFYAKSLLAQPSLISGWLPEKIMMGLPITAYMIMVTFTMILLGTRWFEQVRPFRATTVGILMTTTGLVLCGLAQNIVHLIVARMICAGGFAMIVLYGRQFIVDHSSKDRRAFFLAGFTAAFSGGMFCSITIGGILADYFSYRTVFFIAAAILLFALLFAFFVFGGLDRPAKAATRPSISLPGFIGCCFKDRNLLAVMLHGIVTRIMLIGFYYYSLPIFLKTQFTYADIGRIMMFYGLTSVVMATWLNRYIQHARQSKSAMVSANLIFGSALAAFFIIPFHNSHLIIVSAVGALVLQSITNGITSPSQVNLLLNTHSAHKAGNRVSMAVYQSVERIGSALGPMVFGWLATFMDITQAIAWGGVLCIVGNMAFFMLYQTRKQTNA